MVHGILKAVCVSVQLLFAARMIESAFIERMSEDTLESVCPFLAVIDNAGGFLKLPLSLPSCVGPELQPGIEPGLSRWHLMLVDTFVHLLLFSHSLNRSRE